MAPGLERMNIRGPNKIPMALDNTTFAEVFVPPQGQDWFRRNFGSANSCFKDWLCSASIQVHMRSDEYNFLSSLTWS
jgi:hypothetical protein